MAENHFLTGYNFSATVQGRKLDLTNITFQAKVDDHISITEAIDILRATAHTDDNEDDNWEMRFDGNCQKTLDPKNGVLDLSAWQVRYGKYGRESVLQNRNNGKTHHRTVDDTEFKFYQFSISFINSFNGLLLFEKLSDLSPLPAIRSILQKAIESVCGAGVSVKLNPVVPHQYIDHILDKAKLKKLTFSRYDNLSDISDYDDPKENEARVAYSISAKRGKYLKLKSTLKAMMTGGNEGSMVILNPYIEKYGDTVVLLLESEGHSRTYRIDPNLESPFSRFSINISREVGHTRTPSIKDVADQLKRFNKIYLKGLTDKPNDHVH